MAKPPDVLASIVDHKRREVAAAKSAISASQLNESIAARATIRGFESSLRQHISNGQSGVIAECKKASPSKGVIRANYDVMDIARSYQAGGASCLSVLTDAKFFQGSNQHLALARRVCDLPLLRKDFIIDPYQIRQSYAIGADCILLIVAVLDRVELAEYAKQAIELGLDVLIEVHDEAELDIALNIEHGMLGINNRNLRTFETTLETTLRLSRQVPSDRLVVSESGIHCAADIEMLKSAGIDTFLIGESLMRAANPGAALNELFVDRHVNPESEQAVAQ